MHCVVSRFADLESDLRESGLTLVQWPGPYSATHFVRTSMKAGEHVCISGANTVFNTFPVAQALSPPLFLLSKRCLRYFVAIPSMHLDFRGTQSVDLRMFRSAVKPLGREGAGDLGGSTKSSARSAS